MIISFLFVSLVPATPATLPLEDPVVANGGTVGLTAVVTLITGDVLEVTMLEDGRYTVSITSNSVRFQTISDGEDTYVIPAGVEQLIGDALDMQLFNVDYLIENGYCDEMTTTIPLIIEYSTNPGREYSKINTAPSLLKKQDFESVYASSAEITKEDADEFANVALTEEGLEGVEKIWLDRKVELSLDESVLDVGAPYAWEQGFDGTGIKIAILDTGIWKDHPDLVGKVVAEMDFTDDMTPEDLHGHGTHCAGIAAANGALKGVAPGASLINAKVLNKAGGGQMSWIIAAWEWAADQGAEIFSMSFGGPPTDGTHPMDKALNTIVDEYNIVAVAAAGNKHNYYTIESPAAADKAIAVGATTKRGLPRLSVVSPEERDIEANLMEYSPKPPVEGIEKPIVYAGLGSAEEFAKVVVTGKIALIMRGVYTFREKVQNAANAGAVAAIVFNNVPGNFYGTLEEWEEIPAVSISLEDGTYLLGLLEKGEVLMNLKWNIKAVAMADLSSRGPRLDNIIKPEIVAPGIAIKSTVPTYECMLWDSSGYKKLSGTSMSTPHVAGATALLLQKHPDWKPMQVRDALMSTAEIMPRGDIYTQGSGLVAVDSAIDASIVFDPAEINLGTIAEPWPLQSKSFAIRNYGEEDVTLELTVEDVHDIEGNNYDIATLDTYTLTIPAGKTKTATITINLADESVLVNIPLGGRVIAKNTETGEETHAIFGIYKEKKWELKIKMINPEGEPFYQQAYCPVRWPAYAYVYDAINPSRPTTVFLDPNGEATLRLPPSKYNIFSALMWFKDGVLPDVPIYWLSAIEIPLYEDKTVILDARDAEPVTLDMRVEPTDPSASYWMMQYAFTYGTTFTWAWALDNSRIKSYVLPATSTIGSLNMMFRFEEIQHSLEYEELVEGPWWLIYSYRATQKSQVVYDLLYTMLGEITGATYTVDETTLQQMAMIKAKHFSTDMNPREQTWARPAFPTEFPEPIAFSFEKPYLVPIERDEYLTPNKAGYGYRQFVRPFIGFGEDYRVYETGERLEKTWLEQAIKPWTLVASRADNTITVGGYEAVDANINYGFNVPNGMTFKTEVYRDDELIWSLPNYYYWEQEVTPEEANYRIELYSKNIPGWSNYSTETFTTIKLKSSEEGTENLPIINLNYKIPALRINNVKVVSKKDPLNVHIIPQSLKGLSISEVRFWYSYDDGATWTETSALEGTDEWIVRIDFEAENYISIKTSAIDVEGNSVEQTIMRASYVTTKPQNFWFDD